MHLEQFQCRPSILHDLKTENLARLAFGDHLKRPAADFAIGVETLRRDTGVDEQFEPPAAERAMDDRGCFHRAKQIVPNPAQSNPLLGSLPAVPAVCFFGPPPTEWSASLDRLDRPRRQ